MPSFKKHNILILLLVGLLFFGFGSATFRSLLLIIILFSLFGRITICLIDLNLIILVCVLIIYEILIILNFGFYSATASLVFMPVSAYLIGKVSGIYFKDVASILWFILYVGALISAPTLAAIYSDIYHNGFIGFSRNIALLGNQDEQTSATVLAANLIIPVILFGVSLMPSNKILISFRIISFIFFVVSAVAIIRLGSRTLLVISLFMVFITLFRNRENIKRVIAGVFLSFALFLIFNFSAEFSDIDFLSFYMDRVGDDSAGISSAGGRSDRWVTSVLLIFKHPFGWSFEEVGYAHNLWLDAARSGGFLAFILLSVLFISHSYVFYKFHHLNNIILSNLSFLIFCAYFLLFSVEPILDGFLVVFSSFFLFSGFLIGVLKNLRLQHVG